MKHIMIQGTGSGVGKSIITAGLCRYFANKGFRVAPFKAQNMALNSGVTFDGFEMGRAQILQAEAAKVIPDVRMNPILLKPTGKGFSQIVRMGKPFKVVSYKDYYKLFESNFNVVRKAFFSLEKEYDFLIIEGAGSPAEINLQKFDLVNMRVAELAEANVFIVGDIDRGGVFASFKGTYDLIEDKYKSFVKGFIINKFRGDITLLEPAFEIFAKYCDVPVVGVIPYLEHSLEEEDSQVSFESIGEKRDNFLKVAIIKLPYMSNFSDFTPFYMLEGVYLEYVSEPDCLEEFDVVVIPGSKNSIQDLKFLFEKGFADKIKEFSGRKVIIGICGGFQMLGKKIIDKKGVEGKDIVEGIGLLNLTTEFEKEKILKRKRYGSELLGKVNGYEIHHGITKINDKELSDLLDEKGKFVVDFERKIVGTYLHGVFENSEVLKLVARLAGKNIDANFDYQALKDKQLNILADLIADNIDMDKLWT